MSSYWYILFGLALVWYGYIMWVLLSKKSTKTKKHSKKLDYLRLNDVEDTSKLLEAFREGSFEDDSNSITRKKHEKLKVIRNKDTANEIPPESEN